MSIWNALSANLSDVQNLINDVKVVPGDTVVIPTTDANGVSWTKTLTVTKDIIIQGQGNARFETASQFGTLLSGVETIIRDDATSDGTAAGNKTQLIKWTTQISHTHVRLSGLTLRYGTSITKKNDGALVVQGGCLVAVIDNCHLDMLYGKVFSFDITGVMHHCILDFRADGTLGSYQNQSWNGVGIQGDNSYVDGTHWGTSKFMFIEDCCLNNRHGPGTAFNQCGIDSTQGGRGVMRHCKLNNTGGFSGHGTESSGFQRGQRASEQYNNTISMTNDLGVSDRHMTECRSGSNLEFNNTYIEASPSPGNPFTGRPVICYRYFQPFQAWGGAGGPCQGTSNDWYLSRPFTPDRVWDNVATRSDGTFHFGEAPYDFASGTCTNTATGAGVTDRTMTVAGTPWTPGQWVGYTLINLQFQYQGWPYGNFIVSNTNNSITVDNQNNQAVGIKWNPGDHYIIRKVLVCLDQTGRGGGDLITRINALPVNSARGNIVAPVGQVLEGNFAWNNTLNSAPFTFYATAQPGILQSTARTSENPNYTYGDFNNRAPTKAELTTITDTPTTGGLSGFGAFDSAASNANYVGYQYPHPLAGGVATPAITSQNHANFQVGTAGSFPITTQGFTGTIVYGVTGGSLPSGVTLNTSTGLLSWSGSGTAGTSNFTLTATVTSPAQSATQAFSVIIAAAVTKVIALSGNMAFGNVTINTTATSNLSITNNGNTVLTVSGFTYPTGYSGSWTGGTIAPGATQVVIVTFAPVAGTTYNGTITVSSDKTSGTNTIAVTGLGATRVMGLTGNLAFGSVTTGQTATRQLTITNSGNVTMNISAITYPQGFSGDFTSGAILAGASKIVNVTFSPLAAQAYSGNVDIQSDKTSGTSTVAISGTGVATATKVIQLTGDLSFGSVQTGTTVNRTLTITNSGDTDLTVTGITYPTGFTGAFAGVIASGASHDVTVVFSPVAATSYSGTVTVASDATAGINTTTASGTGVAPATMIIGLSGSLAFGNVQTGTTGTRTLTIANTGSAPLTVSGITYPTGFTGAYSGTIAPGATRDVVVTFSPAAVQSYGGTVTVASDATSGTNTATASGAGVAAQTKIIALTGDLAFGNVQKNHSIQRIMVIANTGTATLAVTNITCPTGFSPNITTATIAPGASQNVTITFRPTAQQSYGGDITVASDKTSGVNTLACSGNGTNKKQVPFILIVG